MKPRAPTTRPQPEWFHPHSSLRPSFFPGDSFTPGSQPEGSSWARPRGMGRASPGRTRARRWGHVGSLGTGSAWQRQTGSPGSRRSQPRLPPLPPAVAPRTRCPALGCPPAPVPRRSCGFGFVIDPSGLPRCHVATAPSGASSHVCLRITSRSSRGRKGDIQTPIHYRGAWW